MTVNKKFSITIQYSSYIVVTIVRHFVTTIRTFYDNYDILRQLRQCTTITTINVLQLRQSTTNYYRYDNL
jgi:hypothetical protein